jgi:ribosomal protein S18 acetylase RimI-like enzyme
VNTAPRPWLIRPARLADVPRLAALDAAAFGPEAWPAAFLVEELTAPDRRYFAAEATGPPAEPAERDPAQTTAAVAVAVAAGTPAERPAGTAAQDSTGGSAGGSAGPLVGYAGIRLARRAEIMSIAVDAPSRGRGIGRALMETLLAQARAAGVARVRLTVAEGSAAAIALYQSLGFGIQGRVPGYYPAARRDGIIMELRADGLGRPTPRPRSRP